MLNKRRQLFEIQDFSWCPGPVRDGVTAYLSFCCELLNIYAPTGPIIAVLLGKERRILDLCAGAGGPSKRLSEELNQIGEPVDIVMCDLYPYQGFKSPNPYISYEPRSVDARDVPEDLTGLRTLFTSFHHFRDEDAKAILEDAFNKQQNIAVFEFTTRSWKTLFLVLPSAFSMFLLLPFLRPFRLSFYLFTYIIPLIPIVALIDIIMSVFRTRRVNECEQLISDLKSDNYQWKTGTLPTSTFLTLTYLVGSKK